MMKLKLIAVLTLAFCLLLPYANGASASVHDEGTGQRQVQAFDVIAGKVVKSVPNSKEYQKFAKSWLGSLTGLAPQLTANDKCGYVFRIPLDDPARLKWILLTFKPPMCSYFIVQANRSYCSFLMRIENRIYFNLLPT